MTSTVHGKAVDLGRDGFGPVAVDVEHRDLGALLGEPAARGRADARATAGDDRSLPGQQLPIERFHAGDANASRYPVRLRVGAVSSVG